MRNVKRKLGYGISSLGLLFSLKILKGDNNMKKLFRPVGIKEMNLIFESDLKEYPPRLPEQPIFYPVNNIEYARQIALEWNTKSAPGFCGFVTQFEIDEDYINRFNEQIVGSKVHSEIWVPAEELNEFNSHIIGKIQVVDSFYGKGYKGLDSVFSILKGKNIVEQFIVFHELVKKDKTLFNQEIKTQWKIILTNYKYWCVNSFEEQDIYEKEKNETLDNIKEAWNQIHPDLILIDYRIF